LGAKDPQHSNSTGLTSRVFADRRSEIPFVHLAVRASMSARAAASSAYLTVSEIFPLEIRALAIAIFYASGTLAGGVAPILFGWIIGTGSRTALLIGYLVGAALMILGAIVEAFIGVDAERKPLEHVATPLSCKL
jgi:MFS family permease